MVKDISKGYIKIIINHCKVFKFPTSLYIITTTIYTTHAIKVISNLN
jgi:hypothetical protein